MTIRSFVEPGAFDPEAITVLGEAFEAAVNELPDNAPPEVARELIAGRIIAAGRLGERNPARLLIAARRVDETYAQANSNGSSTLRLAAPGRLLYGEHWIMPMARPLGAKVNPAEGHQMAKPPTSDIASLGVRERMLLFCVGSGTDRRPAGLTGETVTALVVRGLIVRDGRGCLTLTDDGRVALRALLPGL